MECANSKSLLRVVSRWFKFKRSTLTFNCDWLMKHVPAPATTEPINKPRLTERQQDVNPTSKSQGQRNRMNRSKRMEGESRLCLASRVVHGKCRVPQRQATRKGGTKRRHHPPSRNMGDSKEIHGGLTKIQHDSQFESIALQYPYQRPIFSEYHIPGPSQ